MKRFLEQKIIELGNCRDNFYYYNCLSKRLILYNNFKFFRSHLKYSIFNSFGDMIASGRLIQKN